MGVAEPAALVNDKMNGCAVVDKLVCPCFVVTKRAKANHAFAPYNLRSRCDKSLQLCGIQCAILCGWDLSMYTDKMRFDSVTKYFHLTLF